MVSILLYFLSLSSSFIYCFPSFYVCLSEHVSVAYKRKQNKQPAWKDPVSGKQNKIKNILSLKFWPRQLMKHVCSVGEQGRSKSGDATSSRKEMCYPWKIYLLNLILANECQRSLIPTRYEISFQKWELFSALS